MTTLIRNATVYDGTVGGVHRGADVLFDTHITAMGPGLAAPADARVIEADGAPVVPGYIDIHCHGAAGVAHEDGVEASLRVVAAHLAHGTTRSVLSFVSADVDALAERLAAAATITSPQVLGLHAEGPFLHRDFRGAHRPDLLCDPTPERVAAILDAADGRLAQITLAPERDDALTAIATLTEARVAVAVGHSSATFEQAQAAFAAGASILTHAFNAMRGIHHRAPGPVIAALRDPGVWLEVIADGIHVHPMVVRSLFLEAPDRMVLVTDAMAATGEPDGPYRLGDLEVTVTDGVARLVEGGSLAGSTLTMDRAVARTIEQVQIPVDIAVAAATGHPARAIGVGDRYGHLAPGYPADVLILDPATHLPTEIFLAGVPVS